MEIRDLIVWPHRLEADNRIDFIEKFKQDHLLVVCGSTWPEDEKLMLEFINSSRNIKFIIAPHEIKPEKSRNLKQITNSHGEIF